MTTEANATPDTNTPDAAALAATAAAAAAAATPNPALEVTTQLTAEQQAALDAVNKPVPKADEGKVEAVVYNPTGDVGLDMTLKFVGDLGYAPDHPAMAAAIEGDFSLLEAELAAKGVKGYEAYIKLGQKAYTEVSTKTKERRAADQKAVESIAGGEAEWKAVSEWAQTNADDSEKAVLKTQLAKGGIEAQMAATWLVTNYSRASGVSTEGAGPSVTATRSAAATSSAALDPKAYAAEVAKARQEYKGLDFENAPTYKALQARRMAYRG